MIRARPLRTTFTSAAVAALCLIGVPSLGWSANASVPDSLKLADATSADVVGLLRSLRGGLFVRVTEQSIQVRDTFAHLVGRPFEGYITYE